MPLPTPKAAPATMLEASPAESATRAVDPPPPAPEDMSLPRSPAPQELTTPIPAFDEQPTPTPHAHDALPSPAASHFRGSTGSSTRFGLGASTPPTSHAPESSALSPTNSSVLSPNGTNSMRKSSLAPRGHPNDWNVEEVVDWLRSKGFDEGVCDKFIGASIHSIILYSPLTLQ